MPRNKARRATSRITSQLPMKRRGGRYSVPGRSRNPGSGYSFIIGGGIPNNPEASDVAAGLDRQWFRTHLHRSHPVRRVIHGEVPAEKPQTYAVVRQLKPGVRFAYISMHRQHYQIVKRRSTSLTQYQEQGCSRRLCPLGEA
jgi:hypothetical protein